jgi:predicted enzyme related to lactoylglutathione lyase
MRHDGSPLRGIATISLWADDLETAKNWYAKLLGIAPYFERTLPGATRPSYYEFRIGDYQQELGLIDKRFVPAEIKAGPAGVVVYWHVDNVAATYRRLLDLGAQAVEPPQDRGEGFVTASVIDPFGNVLGVMYNPHYLQVRDGTTETA